MPTICRKTDRRGGDDDARFDVELADDDVVVRCRGRIVGTLTGRKAAAVRAVLHDDERLQRLLARGAHRR